MNDLAVSKSSIYSCQKCRKLYKSESGLYIHARMRHQLQYHRSGPYTPLADERDGDSTTAVTGAGCAAADITAAADTHVTEDAAALQDFLDVIGVDGAGTDIADQLLQAAEDPIAAVSPPPPPPTPLQLPFGMTASSVAEYVYRNHHLSVQQLRRSMEVTYNAGQPLSPDDATLLEGAFEIAVAAERRLATALHAIQDAALGAPELRGQAPSWMSALIRAAMGRPT